MRYTPKSSTVLLLGAFSLLGSCADSSSKEQRLATDLSTALATVERIEAAGYDEVILGDVEELRAGLDSTGWAELPGWAFRRSSIAPYLNLNRPLPKRGELPFGIDFECKGHPLELFTAYARLLGEHGIDLLIVPVPHRLQVYGDALPSIDQQETFAGASAVHSKLLARLAREGVEVVNLLPTFLEARYADASTTDETVFFRQDPHWTPRGLALAADLIAKRVRDFDWFEEGDERRGEHFDVVIDESQHQLSGPTEKWREPVTIWLQRVLGQDGKPAAFRDRLSPVLVIGDSFAGYYNLEGGDLGRHLYARLGQKLDSINSDGFGGSTIWQALQRRDDGMVGKKLVIWVFRFSVLSYPQGQIFDPWEGQDEPR